MGILKCRTNAKLRCAEIDVKFKCTTYFLNWSSADKASKTGCIVVRSFVDYLRKILYFPPALIYKYVYNHLIEKHKHNMDESIKLMLEKFSKKVSEIKITYSSTSKNINNIITEISQVKAENAKHSKVIEEFKRKNCR